MTTTTEIDFDARYAVKGWHGIAFYLIGYAYEEEPIMFTDEDGNESNDWTGDFEKIYHHHKVIAVMVGDNRRHIVDVDDLTKIGADDYCSVCGQIGCHHNF